MRFKIGMMFFIILVIVFAVVMFNRVSIIEKRVLEVESQQQSLCDVLNKFAGIDDELVMLADSQDMYGVDLAQTEIFSARAYCGNAVAIYADARGGHGNYMIRVLGPTLTEYVKGYFFLDQKQDESFSLTDTQGLHIITIDLAPYVRRGDFVHIWIVPNRPFIASYYDSNTGLAVLVKHLDGSFETSIR